MIKTVLLSVVLMLASMAVSSAQYADEFSGARRSNHENTKQTRNKHARATRSHARQAVAGRGESACEPDAGRFCRSVIQQGDMAVLGCFQRQPQRLSGGCRALLRSYGQI